MEKNEGKRGGAAVNREHRAEGARCPGDIGIAPTGVKRRQWDVD